MKETKLIIRNCIFIVVLLNVLSLGAHFLCNTPAEQAKAERFAMLEDPISLRIVMKSQRQNLKN